MAQHIVLTLFSTLCVAFVSLIIHSCLKAYSTPLRHVPGPLLARLTRVWLLTAINSRKYQQINIDLHRKYGPVVRIAPNEYSIDDIESSKVIYRSRDQLVKVSEEENQIFIWCQ